MRNYYRLYCVNDRDRIIGVEETHCDDDESACAHASEKLPSVTKCAGIEVWSGDRFVCRVPRGGLSRAP